MLTSLITVYIAATLDQNISHPTQNLDTYDINISNIIRDVEQPIKNPQNISPIIYSKASISLDRKSSTILYEDNAHDRLSIASLTKLMTALIIIEENQLDEVVQISQNANNTEGSTMYLRTGEEITVENLLKGLLINSANDSSVALAEHNSGSVEKFVEKMNARAQELGLINTHFANPNGLDNSNNYSSAYDIAKLGNYIYNNPIIKDIVDTQNENILSTNKEYTHNLHTTNHLLGNYPGIKGLKTGTTDWAGQCLISIAENENGNEIITVVLNSPDRFKETKVLTDWIFRSYNW